MRQSDAMQSLRDNIRSVLAERGMLQKELAERCGIAASNLNRILNGKEKVTIQRAEKIAKALGVTLSELLQENPDKISAA